MPILHLLLVAVVQGLTEFLPVSSSGHLILLPNLTGLQDQGQVVDVAVHLGTLVAVMVFFRTDVRAVIGGVPDLLRGRLDRPGARLAFLLAISTLPVIAFGLVLALTGWDQSLRSITVIGWTTLVFGLVLYVADRTGPTVKKQADWTLRDAIQMGLWQALALVPGTSRSGITISAARFLGYDRENAARLAMLMSIPTILASGALVGVEVAATANLAAARDGAIAAVFAFLSALLALAFMMRLLRSVSFTPYVIYRVILGVILLSVAYSG